MKNQSDLRAQLRAIDHRSYPAYKDLRGSYDFGDYILNIDHVQGDPFAAPSAVSVDLSPSRAAFPPAFLSPAHRRTALEDFLVRLFGSAVYQYSKKAHGSGKSGLMAVSRPGQEILERSACTVNPDGSLSFRMEIGFPANGRTINSRELDKILFDFLPACVRYSLFYRSIDKRRIKAAVDLADDQAFIREELKKRGLCAFVADGSILPRESGVSELPLKNAIPFSSPESLRVEMDLPHAGRITGMGIRRGITLIAGGGYHGKSTLLRALERGVYNHITGDGREFVVTDDTAMKIRAEDGRSIVRDDISLFISNLPGGRDTVRFSTENASGSTSQAAAVVEAVEAGAHVLLIDEDTSATNFMVRDELMQRVIAPDKEPITPFIDRARQLYEENGISTILALGSCGAWFYPADCILQMDEYRPLDITKKAKDAASAFDREKLPFADGPAAASSAYDSGRTGNGSLAGDADARKISVLSTRRIPLSDRAYLSDRVKTKTMGLDGFVIDHQTVDLRCVEQIVDAEQNACLAQCLIYARRHLMDGRKTLPEIADAILGLIRDQGPGAAAEGSYVRTGYAAPRKAEICAMLSRWRGLQIR